MVAMSTPHDTHIPTSTGRPLTVLVGGTGKTGRRVAARLEAAGHDVRPVSRSTPIPFDWEYRATWSRALRGATAAYITFQPDLAIPESDDAIAALGTVAEQEGVGRLVLLSGRGEPAAQACERILLDGPIPTTVVRCAFFAQNFAEEPALAEPVRAGVIALPAGDVAEPVVDADDVADVAALALTTDGHDGEVYELTGPELLTFHQMAATLSAAAGREIAYLPVTPEQYATEAIAAGLPAEQADLLAGLFAHIFDGHNASRSDGVERALGRPARSFAHYATAAAAAGAWSA